MSMDQCAISNSIVIVIVIVCCKIVTLDSISGNESTLQLFGQHIYELEMDIVQAIISCI